MNKSNNLPVEMFEEIDNKHMLKEYGIDMD